MFSFGGNNQSTGFGNTSQSTGFKFGGATSTPSTGLFGATSAPSTGLFGATATTAPSTGLFGATVTTTPSTGLFGSSTAAPSSTGFSFGAKTTTTPATGGLFGAAANTNTQGTKINQPITLQTIAPDTHYSALPDNMKVELDNLDKMIQDQIHIFESISSSATLNKIQKVSEDTQELTQKLTSLTILLERDNYLINDLKKKVASELRNAELATRFVDRFNSPNQTKDIYSFHDGISEYFENLCKSFEEKMQIYRQSIDEIEQQLLSMSQNTQHNPQELIEILRNQHESIMYLSSKVASLNDDIEKRRQEYQSFRSKYSNDIPLSDSKRQTTNEKFSLSSIASSLRPSSAINTVPAQQTQTSGFGTSFLNSKPAGRLF